MHGRISRDAFIRTRSSGASRTPSGLARRYASAGGMAAIAFTHWGAAWYLSVLGPGGGEPSALRSLCVVVLAGLGAGFGVLVCRVATSSSPAPQATPLRHRGYWQTCGTSLVACYSLGLVAGDHPSAPHLFWVSLALSHAAVWFVLSGAPDRWSSLVRFFQRRSLRFSAWSLSIVLMIPLAGELGLRVYAFAVGDSLMTRYVTEVLKLPAGGDRLGQTVNSLGYWDDEFPVDRLGGGLRVAVLGDEAVLCGDAESNFLAQIERLMPGTDVFNLGVPQTSPREYAAQLDTTVAACRPDVVLVSISVATDITDAPPLPGAFDWRSLHLVQRSMELSRWEGACDDVGGEGGTSPNNLGTSECLDEAARQLQVCRVPVRETLQARWRVVFQHLDGLLRQCRDEGIEPMLVVLPCEFQVDQRLRETLCRRAGYRTDQIDLDLPQRRLAAYAKDRRIQMLDLMPHLRASREPSFRCEKSQLNRHGNSLAALVLCEWLESHYGSTLLASGS